MIKAKGEEQHENRPPQLISLEGPLVILCIRIKHSLRWRFDVTGKKSKQYVMKSLHAKLIS